MTAASLVLLPPCELTAARSLQPALNFHHTQWTSENGLGSVFDIKQSGDGYLWLTTSKGVVRFDGVRFQSIEEVTFGAVDNDEIDSVFVSQFGGLWLTTTNAGLLFWKDGKLTAFPDRRCAPTRKMGKLIEDGDRALWVQGASGLFRLRGTVCEQMGAAQGYPGGFPAGIFLDSKRTLWVKTRTGPLLFLPHGQTKFQRSNFGDGATASYAWIHEAPNGAIWLSDDHGLRDVSRIVKTEKVKSPYGDFTFGSDGSLWAVTPGGVKRFSRVQEWPKPVAVESSPGDSFTPANGLSSDAAWKILIDRENNIWVATNSGLDRLRRTVLTKLLLPPAQERQFSVAAGDGGSVWTGNSSLPLTQAGAGGTTSYSKIHHIVCLRRDHTGRIWASGMGESVLWRYQGGGFVPLPYPRDDLEAVVSIAVDSRNDPWITKRNGLAYRYLNGEWISQNETLGKKPGVIGAMTDDDAGNIWFAFSDKVVQWNGSTYHRFVRKGKDVSQTTMHVRGDRVWLGGAGGVQLFRQGKFHLMQWKHKELPGRVSGLVETKSGDLWINGFSGITHVTAAELSKWLRDPAYRVGAEHFEETDGLPGLSGEKLPEPSVVEAPDGRLWFATIKGIAWLDPAELERNRNRLAPPVTVAAIISDAKAYPAKNDLKLPARTENLEIQYAGLSIAIPERMLFRYKLDGVDEGWQNAGTRRQAYYTKLRPGRYTFRVAACNNDGVWNEAGATLRFDITPAWFQTSWFRALCVACGIALLFGLHRLRVHQIAARINARFDDRLAERTRIAQELHDTLLQGFLSVYMQINVAADAVPADSKARPILIRAIQLMSRVIDEGRNAVRGLRSSQSLSLDLEEAFAQIPQELDVADGPGADFRVIVEGEQRALRPLLRDEVYWILREAIINAFRHARAGRIEVSLIYTAKQLRGVVRDDGRGIDSEILRSGRDGHFGLRGMQERADRIGARLRVVSRLEAGTEVELSVPGRVAFQDSKGRLARQERQDEPVDVPSTRVG